MRDALLDIIKHTGGLGFVDTVKITGTKDQTIVEAIDKDRTMIIKGKLHSSEETLAGEFGIGNMTNLQQLLAHFNGDAKITVDYKVGGDKKKNPSALQFTDAQKQKAIFRLVGLDYVPDQPKFLGATWDVVVKPNKSKIAELASMVSIMGGVDTYFTAKVAKNELQFWIGSEESATNSMFIKVSEELEDVKSFEMDWPHTQIMSILKLGVEEQPEIHISNKGAMLINIKSKLGEYNYILPARKR